MGTLKNTNKKVFNISPNIIMSIDENNIGEMYIYDSKYGYVLNGVTASDLVDYFVYKNNKHLSKEIINILMTMTINKGTH
jgi:hypothetical protein